MPNKKTQDRVEDVIEDMEAFFSALQNELLALPKLIFNEWRWRLKPNGLDILEMNLFIPIELTVRTVDSFDEPLSDVTVEIRELKLKANTDADGWAHFIVRPGQWTLVASKNRIADEKS